MNRKTTGLLFFLLIFQCSVHAQQKIPLNSAMLYNFSTKAMPVFGLTSNRSQAIRLPEAEVSLSRFSVRAG